MPIHSSLAPFVGLIAGAGLATLFLSGKSPRLSARFYFREDSIWRPVCPTHDTVAPSQYYATNLRRNSKELMRSYEWTFDRYGRLRCQTRKPDFEMPHVYHLKTISQRSLPKNTIGHIACTCDACGLEHHWMLVIVGGVLVRASMLLGKHLKREKIVYSLLKENT